MVCGTSKDIAFLKSFDRPGQIVCPMSIGRARVRKTSGMHPIFQARKFLPCKKKKLFHLKIYSRIGKTTKKL